MSYPLNVGKYHDPNSLMYYYHKKCRSNYESLLRKFTEPWLYLNLIQTDKCNNYFTTKGYKEFFIATERIKIHL